MKLVPHHFDNNQCIGMKFNKILREHYKDRIYYFTQKIKKKLSSSENTQFSEKLIF